MAKGDTNQRQGGMMPTSGLMGQGGPPMAGSNMAGSQGSMDFSGPSMQLMGQMGQMGMMGQQSPMNRMGGGMGGGMSQGMDPRAQMLKQRMGRGRLGTGPRTGAGGYQAY